MDNASGDGDADGDGYDDESTKTCFSNRTDVIIFIIFVIGIWENVRDRETEGKPSGGNVHSCSSFILTEVTLNYFN